MCSKRYLLSSGFVLALCFIILRGYSWYLKETLDGGYTEWSTWGNCSKHCGDGVQTRVRLCENPPPGRYAKDCYRFGPSQDSKPCFLKICPVDGKYSDWTAYSACDKPCGGGKQFRTRQCNNPPPVFGGKPCEGPAREEQECNKEPCQPVDGGFTDWSPYSACSVTCGKGSMTRTRSCTKPAPLYGGKPCEGPVSETSECDKGPCKQPEISAKTAPKADEKAPQDAQKPVDAAQNPKEKTQ